MTNKEICAARSSAGSAPEIKPTHSADGVDLTLIRWMLSLTPAERLEVLQQTVRSIIRMRGETNH